MTEEKRKRVKKKKEPQLDPVITFPDGREKFSSELTEEDILEAQAIVNAAAEDIVRNAAQALENLLNPFMLSCKLISFTFPMGASEEEVSSFLQKTLAPKPLIENPSE